MVRPGANWYKQRRKHFFIERFEKNNERTVFFCFTYVIIITVWKIFFVVCFFFNLPLLFISRNSLWTSTCAYLFICVVYVSCCYRISIYLLVMMKRTTQTGSFVVLLHRSVYEHSVFQRYTTESSLKRIKKKWNSASLLQIIPFFI